MDAAIRASCKATEDWEDRGEDEKSLVLSDLRNAGYDLLTAIAGEKKREGLRDLLRSTTYLKARNDRNIPWEFLYLGPGDGPVDIGSFFGSAAVVGRPFEANAAAWIPARPNLLSSSPLGGRISGEANVHIGVAQDIRLPSAKARTEIKIFTEKDVALDELAALNGGPSALAELERFVESSPTLTHFNCHAIEERPDLGNIKSSLFVTHSFGVDRDQVARLPVCEHSIVVLNCCHGITLRHDVTETIATAFAGRRTSAVVATTGEISDAYATGWARHFYDRLLNGETVGNSILHARKEMIKATGNLSALLYAFIGHYDACLPRELELAA